LKELVDIFICYVKIGFMTFGGGFSMMPVLRRELVDKRNWATDEEVMDFFAIAQCLPGIIAVNTATLTGRRIKGVAGGLAAALGVITPSLAIIVTIAAFFRNFLQYAIVQKALFGIRIAVAALIFDVIVKLWKSGVRDVVSFILYAISFTFSIAFNISPQYLIIFAVAAGILAIGFMRKRDKRR